MANTYTQLYIHLVFAVKYRRAFIRPGFREQVERYITGILQNKGHKLLAIYLMPDHAHVFIGLNPVHSISETVRVIKTESTNYINDHKLSPHKFRWQEGYGAFSHSRSAIKKVSDYIMNQPAHHRKRTFEEEYMALLDKLEIPYDKKYLFDFF